ncbi:hypothetical protein COCOR_00311 [Corallococcus coralloides DSM 2259]|uniref:DUF2381 family protein n=1 Tax=Corallococcus coralloides (strain ATCC 25202 / DSM 2259 / NBRC 100086 / M2) TaxID=1144275 RepID=H8MY82_CORCM|nr:DUF2381 family protein [Corallococcus coralloides]AFE03408.1 hypothetical protein COCOR_00311 [Corallococcus coralloides DSM 2259]
MLLFLLPFLAAADGGMSDDAATPLPEQVCADIGLSAMLAEMILDQRGVQMLELRGPETGSSGAEFHFMSFRSARRVAVQLKFFGRTPLPGKAAKASLHGPNHQTLRVVGVVEVAPDAEDGTVRIIVEAEAQAHEARGVYTLELQDAEGTKLLVLPGVRFPSI